ncbi:MAG: quinolinate synthase NadA [Deltaproteobacteria bacterium]|nr:quinolinate synthase NadA [Deltaproteobacteria bacterium]
MATLEDTILDMKKRKNALIIAHYYQEPDIQDIADYVGDSLGMALYAQKQECDIAVVCGVKFMAETIKVMNPNKKILLPDLNAGCSLADSCTPQIFDYFKKKHPGAFVMTYVNSSLEVKAMSDVIVTSSNSVKIAKQLPKDQKIIFGPDQHLGRYVAKQSGRELVLFPGNCFVHTSFSTQKMFDLKKEHPKAKIIAHPECEEIILEQADFIGSTTQLLQYTQDDAADTFIVMTETGILHQMQKASPNKTFIMGPDLTGCACNDCPHMKLNTMAKVLDCLNHETPEINVDPELAEKALKPLDKMVEMTLN